MIIRHTQDNDVLTIWIEGRLDTSTADQLRDFLSNHTEGIRQVIFDMRNLE